MLAWQPTLFSLNQHKANTGFSKKPLSVCFGNTKIKTEFPLTTIDFSNYEGFSQNEKIALGEKLFQAFKNDSIAAIKLPRFDYSLFQSHYDHVKTVIDLPSDQLKAYVSHPASLTGIQFDVGFNPHDKSHENDPKRLVIKYRAKDNQLPTTECPEFLPSSKVVFETLHKLGVLACEALGLYLQNTGTVSDPPFFKKMVFDESGQTNFSTLWVNHYPATQSKATPPPNASNVIGAEHKDTSLLTLLPPATQNGLEVFHPKQEQWLPISLSQTQNKILIFPSGLMSKVTNNLIPHNKHRVMTPPNPTQPRTSLTLFLLPHKNRPVLSITGQRLFKDGVGPAAHCLKSSAAEPDEHLVTVAQVHRLNPAFGHRLQQVTQRFFSNNSQQ